jgi:hypothetical protein
MRAGAAAFTWNFQHRARAEERDRIAAL